MKLASVILDIPTQALDAPYTYAAPEEAGDQPIEVGCAVLVPFGPLFFLSENILDIWIWKCR